MVGEFGRTGEHPIIIRDTLTPASGPNKLVSLGAWYPAAADHVEWSEITGDVLENIGLGLGLEEVFGRIRVRVGSRKGYPMQPCEADKAVILALYCQDVTIARVEVKVPNQSLGWCSLYRELRIYAVGPV